MAVGTITRDWHCLAALKKDAVLRGETNRRFFVNGSWPTLQSSRRLYRFAFRMAERGWGVLWARSRGPVDFFSLVHESSFAGV